MPASTAKPRGATHTIAQLLAAEGEHPAGTIRGRVVRLGAVGDVQGATVDDGTGRLYVEVDLAVTVFGVRMREMVELDVVVMAHEAPERDFSADDPQVAGIMQRFLPSAPAAAARAVRPIPQD
jgi:hypothetical protein